MTTLKLKVCGMKNAENLIELSGLGPDFIGLIFYPKSPRYVVGKLSHEAVLNIPDNIARVGVFVNEELEKVQMHVENYQLDLVQLHGSESVDYCRELKKKLKVVKAFAIEESFDFSQLIPYQGVVDFFLFDTKTPKYGGSGQQFNWEILTKYPLQIPYFLSGGIGLNDIHKIIEMNLKRCFAIDINSKVEIEPGLKNLDEVRKIKEILDKKISLKSIQK